VKDATAGRDGPPWLVRWMPFTDSMQLAGRPSATAGQPGSLEMIVRSRRGSQSVVGTPVANARRAAALRVCLGSAWWLSCRVVHGDLRTLLIVARLAGVMSCLLSVRRLMLL